MIDVKLKNFVENRKYLDNRSLELQINNKRIYTPIRILLYNNEIKAKRRLPTQIPLNHDIIIIDLPVNVETLISTKNGTNANLQRVVKKLEAAYGDFNNIHQLIPYIYATKSVEINEKNIDLLMTKLSILYTSGEYNFNAICIQPFELSYSKYINILDKISRTKPFEKITIIPIIDIKYKEFVKLLDYLRKKDYKLIGIKYRKITNFISNYAYIYNEFRDKDIGFLVIDTPEKQENVAVENFAIRQYLPMLSYDLIGSRLSHNRIPYNIFINKEKTIDIHIKFEFLQRRLTQILDIEDIKKNEREELFNEIITTKESKSFNELVDILRESPKDLKSHIIKVLMKDKKNNEEIEKYMRIRSFCKLQETVASNIEYKYLQEFILKNDINGYYSERQNITKFIEKDTNTANIKKKSIFDFQ